MNALRQQYLLDPSVIFLNHGSFGATPKPVFEAYQRWQLELERQPVEFIGRRIPGLLHEARKPLAKYLGTSAERLAFVTNTTYGINMIARGMAHNLKLKAGDEVLTTDHEYGAVDRTWINLARDYGFGIVHQTMPLPMTTREAFVERFMAGVTPRTRVISISHITSPTALIFPVKEICAAARARGILTVVDGAHAPGQIDLALDELDADVYVGNLHKWLSAPKGAAFVYARPEIDKLIEPLIVSWGWLPDKRSEHPLQDYFEMQGTREFAQFLATPDAIDFQQKNDWGAVRAHCHKLVCRARLAITAMSNLPPLSPLSTEWFMQLVSIPLPQGVNTGELKTKLYERYRIEVPLVEWSGKPYVRVSAQAHTRDEDIEQFIQAIKTEVKF